VGEKVNDPAAPTRDRPRSVLIRYGKGQGYLSIHTDGTHGKEHLPGDPEKYEINVEGVILHYDEIGRVFRKSCWHSGVLHLG
jgi:hypothetical protein